MSDYNEETDPVVLHRRVETPGWDTKLRCSCGFEANTKREMAIHEFGQGRRTPGGQAS